jgi:hypothetical protein
MSNWAPDPVPGEPCPSCLRRVPIPKEDRTPRKREQFNIAVPQDAAENGTEVLRTFIEEARKKIGRPEGTPPYYIIVEALHDYITR